MINEESLKELAELCDAITNLVGLLDAKKEAALDLYDELHTLEEDVTEYSAQINRLYETLHYANLRK